MVPLNALIIPLSLLLRKAPVDRLSGVIVTYLAFVLPFTVWTLRGFIVGVPEELEEAAMVDGSTRFGAFLRILFPLVAPGPGRDLGLRLHPGVERVHPRLRPDAQPGEADADGLAGHFTTNRGTEWGALMAGATLAAIPVVVFFLLVQRRIASG